MSRFATQPQAAHHYQVSHRTIQNWIGAGYIRGYRIPSGSVIVDLDDIDRALESRPRTQMRDGRTAYGPKADIVAAPHVILAETRS